ncbi:LutC/YkgG family protein [Segetibacter koreensis]|uniref:LutC/YkgG family protein n=1 Tax=Segetibacter koreensis TaxID=398037 RepID=UPI000367D317|nr:LUD domain-containing protein [Segetibacter koreensis]
MSSREQILASIKQNRPTLTPLPDLQSFDVDIDLKSKFVETLTGIGGMCTIVNDFETVKDYLLEQQAKGLSVIQGVTELEGYNLNTYSHSHASNLETIDTVLINGHIAVAENGAIWVREKDILNRLIPFICQNLIIVIAQKDIVANMHKAYEKITIDEDGYGVFIAGPSKTADIEQSLVIGAHGPLSLKVFIVQQS